MKSANNHMIGNKFRYLRLRLTRSAFQKQKKKKKKKKKKDVLVVTYAYDLEGYLYCPLVYWNTWSTRLSK